ncbi:MAG: xylulokinase [Anaerolineales bacterium]|nr:xylulokinase [Anaerolineales bacterium]
MSKTTYLIGIDISTTGAKALLIDERGQVTASATTPLSLSTPYPLWSEQDPHEWWSGAVNSIRHALAQVGASGKQVRAIGLTGQMHGLVLLDVQNRVLRPAILWNDQRTGAECKEITDKLGFDRLLRITGNKALTGFTAPKILWVRMHEPQIYAQIAHVLLPKDYVRFRLTGAYAVDKADGAGMLLFDLQKRDFSDEVLEILEIPRQWMPRAFEGPEITGVITPEAAAETGLEAGTPVVGGGGDQAAQAVGVGAVTPGIVALTLGTSGVVFATTPGPLIEPQGRLHAFCHSVPAAWHFMGVMLSAAGSLQWYRDTLAAGVSFDDLLAPARDVPPGSDGLFFLPYLTGERTPHPDPLARGAFVGLTVRHSQAHMTRAVLEGVAFGLRDSMELIKKAGLGEIQQVRVSGGGARSPLWRQILSDVMDVELVTVNTTEGAALGAALLAGVGAGVWSSVVESCQAVINTTDSTLSNPSAVQVYQKAYPLYQGLYYSLKPTFDAVGNGA